MVHDAAVFGYRALIVVFVLEMVGAVVAHRKFRQSRADGEWADASAKWHLRTIWLLVVLTGTFLLWTACLLEAEPSLATGSFWVVVVGAGLSFIGALAYLPHAYRLEREWQQRRDQSGRGSDSTGSTEA